MQTRAYPRSNASSGAGTAHVLWVKSRTDLVATTPAPYFCSITRASDRQLASTHFASIGTLSRLPPAEGRWIGPRSTSLPDPVLTYPMAVSYTHRPSSS